MLSNETVFNALADVREGRIHLNRNQQADFIAAVEEVARVLLTAPQGNDAFEHGLWQRFERTPALAKLADAARPGQPSLVDELDAERVEDARVVRQLQARIHAGR